MSRRTEYPDVRDAYFQVLTKNNWAPTILTDPHVRLAMTVALDVAMAYHQAARAVGLDPELLADLHTDAARLVFPDRKVIEDRVHLYAQDDGLDADQIVETLKKDGLL